MIQLMPLTCDTSWHVLETCDEHIIEEICRFRVSVWREQGQLASHAFPNGQWRDPIDDQSTHWLIRDSQGSCAAAGRLSMHGSLAEVHQAQEYLRFGLHLPGPVAAPDRVVVASFARESGLGRQILDLQDAAAQALGASHAVRQASPRMVQLLQHRGWQALGPASPDDRFPGVEFQVVVKKF
jgi:predicted GNAT family N-acyltransferase